MAGQKVRGITIEVSADTKSFNKDIKALSTEIKSTQGELNALQKGLELEFDSTKFKRAQEVAQQALDETAVKADALRSRLKNLEDAGATDTDEYKKWQTELAKTETEALKLTKQIDQLNKMPLDNLTKQIDGVATGFTKAGQATKALSTAAAGGIAALGALGLKAVSVGDDIATAAVQLGITAEQYQEFQYVALQTDVDLDKLSKGFVKARAAVADLTTGVQNNASKALQQLGVDVASFESADAAFYGIIDALGKMGSGTEMIAAANEIFGDKLANDLIPIIKTGGEAIAEFAAEYQTLGGLTNEQVDKLAAFDNVLNKIKTQFQNIFLQIGTAFLPILEKLAAFINERVVPTLERLAEWFGKLSTEQLEFGLKALAAVAMISPLLTTIGKLTGAISGIIKILPSLKAGLSSLAAHPIILIIAVIAAILAILYTQSEEFREAINRLVATLGEALAPVLDIVMGLLQSVMSLLAPIIAMVGDILANALNILLDALSPVFDMIQMLFGLLQPFITIALLPLQFALTALQVPLQLIGQLLNWLMPLFNAFAKVVEGVFGFVMKIINTVLGWVETAINWVIDKINGLIRGINNLGGWLGIHINEIQHVSLSMSAAPAADEAPATTVDTSGAPSASGGFAYDGINTDALTETTVNNDYDYSTKNTTQTVNVTIQNYAAELDVDNAIYQINKKLAEQM